MTDKIKALAQSYANQFDEEDRVVEYDFALPVIEWLAKQFEFVSKQKILEAYDNVKLYSDTRAVHALMHLFPQTLNTDKQ